MNKYSKNYDIVIRNGCVVDGTGNPYYYADVAVDGNMIAAVGDLSKCTGTLEINAAGKYVTPGFIDSHSHSDATIWANPECQSTIRQGVTTEIVGNCGMNKPSLVKTEFSPDVASIVSIYDALPPEGNYPRVFDKLEALGISENMAFYCGHNKLRQIAGIIGKDYTEEQFAIMEKNLREALDAGFIGFTTGLEFIPGKLAESEEIDRLVKIVKEYDGIYATHARNRDSEIYASTEEFVNIIRHYRIRGVYSHLNVRDNTNAPENALRNTISYFHKLRQDEKLNIVTDMIPSVFGMGQMRAILPNWVTAEGWEEARKILSDPEQRKKLRTDCDRYWRFINNGDWWRVKVQYVPPFPEISNMSFPDIAKLWGKDEWDCFFDILAAAKNQSEAERCVMMAEMFTEQDLIDSVVLDPLFMWEVDGYTTTDSGPLAETTAAPKHYRDMMYFFTRYVRDLKVIGIEKAVSKVTSFPASFYRFEKRGQIAEGYYADINVFALDNLKPIATFENPCVYSSGMDYVIVNGTPVIAEGEHTHARPGCILKRYNL